MKIILLCSYFLWVRNLTTAQWGGDGLSVPQLGAGIIWTLLHAHFWFLSWDDCKADLSWDCQLECVHVASPCGLGFLQHGSWVPRGRF